MRAWRIADRRHPIFDGAGAATMGGRWNSAGRGPIYAAESYAGALLERLIHANIKALPGSQQYVEITIPDDVEREELFCTEEELTVPQLSRARGDKWFDELRSAVLLVPSIATRVERNLLFNPRHKQFALLGVSEPKPVWWDPRLFRR
jgi:RES domain-containing protein